MTALVREVESSAAGAPWVLRMVDAIRAAGGAVAVTAGTPIEPADVLVAALSLRPDRGPLGYGERLDRSQDVARVQRAAATRLAEAPGQSRSALAALAAALDGTLVAGCVTACCEASWVRHQQLQAKAELLRAIGRIDRAAIGRVDAATLAWLLAPPGRQLALPALGLLARSPWAARAHRDLVLRALDHTDPAVVAQAVRALRAAGMGRPVLSALLAATRDRRPDVVIAALRALDRLAWSEPGVAEAFARAVEEPMPHVRAAALWMLERRGSLADPAWTPVLRRLATGEPHRGARAIAARAIAAREPTPG
jgi:hypothetical protein